VVMLMVVVMVVVVIVVVMDSWVRDLVSVQCFLSLPPPTFPSLFAD